MSYLTEKKFSFESTALPPDTFAVVEFKGSEALSRPYEFEIMLVTERSDIELDSVLQKPASFTFHRETGGDVKWNGMIAQFEQLHNFNVYTFYRAHLVPRLWWLQLTHHNQIFLDKTVKEIIEAVLKDGGLTSMDFDFKLQNHYSKIDYVCQYEESHYDFISRWMEREGLYYYFEQTENGEKVIFTDTKTAHTGMPLGDTLYYSPPSGLDTLHRTEVIQSFSCRQKLIPSKVFMKDYNYETPSLTVTGSAPVDLGGRGDIYFYGENFRNATEGNRLAKIRSEEILCRKEQYIGESTVPFVMPGYSFNLEDHYRSDFNREYLTISVDCSGSQSGYLIAGIQESLGEREKRAYYSNTFTAIPYSVQFRTERRTKKSKIYGTLPAKVDAAGSGQYAELDDQGRYKVIMPFDESGRKDGKASIFLRMVQPYAGGDHGMHFPLHKGTEVMIAFTDGDPDRPIIAGAVPNPETQSVVNKNNQTSSVIQTGGQNKIAIEDQEGSERILMQTPKANSWIRMGTPNDPDWDPNGLLEPESELRGELRIRPGDGTRIQTAGHMSLETGGAPSRIPYFEYDATNGETVGRCPESADCGDAATTSRTLDAHERLRLDLVEGDMVEHITGNKYTRIGGTWDCLVDGHLTNHFINSFEEHFHGVKKEVQYAPIEEWNNSTSKEYYRGDVTNEYGEHGKYIQVKDTYCGDKHQIVYGAESNTNMGSQEDVNIANKNELLLGLALSIAVAMRINITPSLNINLVPGVNVFKRDIDTQACTVRMDRVQTEIKEGALHVFKGQWVTV